MNLLLILVCLAMLASLAVVLRLLIKLGRAQNRLKDRIATLETALAAQTVPPSEARAAQADPHAPPAPPWGPAVRAEANRPPEASAAAPAAPEPDRPNVFARGAGILASAGVWALENWFLVIGAVSLALAGVFLIQYGIQSEIFTPFWRVMAAAALGLALIWSGETIRRRRSDDAGTDTAHLPSTFTGAGLIVLFSATLGAEQLYGLIGPGVAFALLLAVSAAAVAMGWFYGPYLAAVGILGSVAAPFLVDAETETPEVLFYYFALIAIAGLFVDAVRRWTWVSVLVLILAHGAAALIFAGAGGGTAYLIFGVATAVAAAMIPPLRWIPEHSGPTFTERLLTGAWGTMSDVKTGLAVGGFAAGCGVAAAVALDRPDVAEAWTVVATLSVLYLAATVWMRHAVALADLAALPAIGLVLFLVKQGTSAGSLLAAFSAPHPPETPPPLTVTILAAVALAGSAIAYWRSTGGARFAMIWTAGAALLAPVALAALEIYWQPGDILGAALWGGHALAAAAAMVIFTERAARADAPDKRRAALLTLSALALIAFAVMVMLTETALTLALAAMVPLAALIDRWQKMPALGWFILAAVAVTSWRLIFDPGLGWAEAAPIYEIWLGYGVTILLFVAAWVILRPMPRPQPRVVLESAVWTLSAAFLSVLILRSLGVKTETYWGLSLLALVWIAAMAAQIWRLKAGGALRGMRVALAAVFALASTLLLGVSVTLMNPLLNASERVVGPPVADTLFVAYALPGLACAAIAMAMTHLSRRLRLLFGIIAAGLLGLYLGLEIRHLWRGDNLAVPGTTDPELYSYTVAMLIVSCALLFVAFTRRSVALRRIAMAGIALTAAKVFLIDMSGLAGLIRVSSFLGLGLALAGLAWVNRLMTARWTAAQPPDPDPPG